MSIGNPLINLPSLEGLTYFMGIYVPQYFLIILDLIVIIFSALLIRKKEDIYVFGIFYILLGITTFLNVVSITFGILVIIILYALWHFIESEKNE